MWIRLRFPEHLGKETVYKSCHDKQFCQFGFTTKMENTTVESFHCRFIYEAIQGASVYHGSKWEDIAIRLISYSKINEITERNLSTDVRKKYYETFEAWRHSKGETATLGKLIEVLEIEKLPIAAQNIRDKYGITRSTSRPAGFEFGYRRFNSVVKQT